MFVLGNPKRRIPQFVRGKRPAVADDILTNLRRIAEEAQCDCPICDTATAAADELTRLRNERDELRQLLMHIVKSYARWTPTRGHIQLEEQERALARFDQLSREWWRG
jgi:hypothetical protein